MLRFSLPGSENPSTSASAVIVAAVPIVMQIPGDLGRPAVVGLDAVDPPFLVRLF